MNQTSPINDDDSAKQNLLDEAISNVVRDIQNGATPRLNEYLARFPDCAQTLGEIWTALLMVEGARSGMFARHNEGGEQGDSLVPIAADLTGLSDEDSRPGSQDSQSGAFIGRYVIIRRLGQGGFGTVLLARDSELDRLVAIKLPHVYRMKSDVNKQMYLREAKTLARLDHPGIVPIYDCGVVPDGRCFVVSKYIEGRDLARVFADDQLSTKDFVRLMADVAQALHYVHKLHFVHRDIKPANLLLGNDGRVYIADFGLALHEGAASTADSLAGTPGYMSPEQLRREGHRVDGRSDQFSLGVVMYEFLAGERPFLGSTPQEILRRILSDEPAPPQQINPTVPGELNRICLKLLSKLASQRYEETLELFHELRDWLKQSDLTNSEPRFVDVDLPSTRLLPTAAPAANADAKHLVVPRGLRSFTRNDAYFFLDLLPGTRDRDGLPNVLSHWKRWVTARDESIELQRVGVISGPTGCGKSSLVRAGLIPILGSNIVPVMVDATADLTEQQLNTAIDRRCSEHLSGTLPEIMAQVRRGNGLRSGKSLLIIIDQFEQWLHSHPDPLESDLVNAIRQCDGVRIQCLLLIRDDFWLALSRFMEVIEAPMQLGRNVTMIDLFDVRHAKKVLKEFGRGYNQLPLADSAITRDQEKFLDGAIGYLTTGGKIIPVHLALFAEMIKNRDWTPATLRQLGGTVGIGAQFLNESFSAMYAPANQRTHEEAARKILQALLPALGTEIKTGRKTRAELQTLSNYGTNQAQFEQLMSILESDLKLISAADFLERTRSDASSSNVDETTYQLSHDFLVPSIREYLNSRQRQSWRGRLHQRLTEQAGLWNDQPKARFLPGMLEWAQMRCCIPSQSLTETESKMMAASDRRHIRTLAVGLICFCLLALGTQQLTSRFRLASLVDQLSTADVTRAPQIVDELKRYGATAETELDRKLAGVEKNSGERLAILLAHLNWSPRFLDEAFTQILDVSSLDYVPMATQAMLPYAKQLTPKCWNLIQPTIDATTDETVSVSEDAKFRAAQLLAKLDPPTNEEATARWNKSAELVAGLLVSMCLQHPDQYALIADSLTPASTVLISPLSKCLGEEQDNSRNRTSTTLLASYLRSDPKQRTVLSVDSADWQKPLMIQDTKELDQDELLKIVKNYQNDPSSPPSVATAKRTATAAAVIMAHSSQERWSDVLDLLKASNDNTCRTELIRLLAPNKVPIQAIVDQIKPQRDVGILTALILALGDYEPATAKADPNARQIVEDLFRNHPSPSVHSATQWLLTEWGQDNIIESLPRESEVDARNGPSSPKGWIRMPQGHLMVRVNATKEQSIGRNYLIAATEVSVTQFKQFDPNKYVPLDHAPLPDCPIGVVTWPQAAKYCNWLSEREGLPLFYPSADDELNSWASTDEHLKGLGYRLPTDAEWVLAAYHGATTPLFLGSDLTQLKRYDWIEENNAEFRKRKGWPEVSLASGGKVYCSKPVGLLRPNDFGLFDVNGNSSEWCDDMVMAGSSIERAVRSFGPSAPSRMKMRISGSYPPLIQYDSVGMRVARTLPADE